jgi:hypothetical protein
MRPIHALVPALALLLAACGGERSAAAAPAAGAAAPAPAQPAAATRTAAPAQPDAKQPDEFERMIVAAGLQGERLAAFNARVQQRHERFQAWNDGPQGRRLAAAREEQKAATAAKDEARASQLAAEVKTLDGEQFALRSRERAEVMLLLTHAERRAWAATVLTEAVLRAFSKAGLDQAQQTRVADLAKAAAPELDDATITADPYLRQTLREPRQRLEMAIESGVLTDEQRAAREARRQRAAKPAKSADPAAGQAVETAPAPAPAK